MEKKGRKDGKKERKENDRTKYVFHELKDIHFLN